MENIFWKKIFEEKNIQITYSNRTIQLKNKKIEFFFQQRPLSNFIPRKFCPAYILFLLHHYYNNFFYFGYFNLRIHFLSDHFFLYFFYFFLNLRIKIVSLPVK